MNTNQLKELIKEVIAEEQDYEALFKHMLNKTGKSLKDMSPNDKSTFFNKCDVLLNNKIDIDIDGLIIVKYADPYPIDSKIVTLRNTLDDNRGNANVTGTLTTSGITITGGIQNTPIGNATPSTGAFTTLSATGATTLNTVTGASFQGAVGNVTPNTGAFTTLTASGTLTLTNALAVTSGGTGTTTSTGTGSVVLNTNPTFAGVVNFAQANVSGLNVTTINVSVVNVTTFTANTISIGQLTYAATGNFVSFGANSNTYQQVVIENSNTGTQASADFVVSTLASTDSTFYGDFGMNGPNFVGTASAFDKANNVYLYSANADLAIGTQSANAIHFITNYSATDAMTISSAGIVSLGTALAYASGGTGSSSYTTGQVLVAGVSGFQSLANVSTTITGALGGNNTITSITTDSYGRLTAYTGTAISGLTVGQGGTGATSFNTNGIVYGGSSLTATASAGTSDQTWTNQILTVTNAGVPVWSTTMDGGTF